MEFSELLLVNNSKGQSQQLAPEGGPLWPSFSHIPILHLLVGNVTQWSRFSCAWAVVSKLTTRENHLRSLSENSKPHLRGSDCMGVTWALGVWIFASRPDRSQDQVAVGIPWACLCIKHSEITGMKYLNYVPTERC